MSINIMNVKAREIGSIKEEGNDSMYEEAIYLKW